MNRVWVIAGKDIREAFRSRSTYLYLVVLLLLSFTYFNSFSTLINRAIENGSDREVIFNLSQVFLNNIASTLPIMYSVLMCSIFAAYSIIVDKSKRTLESLMVTPISLNKIWFAKTLGVTIPSVIIALGISLIAYLTMNFALVVPNINELILPDWPVIFTDVVLIPVLIFFVVVLVIYFQLVVSNPRVANLVFTGIFLLLFFGTNFIAQLGFTVDYRMIFLGLIVVCGGLSYLFSRSLTKERVILSNKG